MLKSIGFTPLQVVACYVLLVAVPAVTGAVIGVACGNLLAAPLYRQNAQAYQVGRAPKPKHGFVAQRLLARLTRVPRPVTLGFASAAARPGRTFVTAVAVLLGAAAVTFGLGLRTLLGLTRSSCPDTPAGTQTLAALYDEGATGRR